MQELLGYIGLFTFIGASPIVVGMLFMGAGQIGELTGKVLRLK